MSLFTQSFSKTLGFSDIFPPTVHGEVGFSILQKSALLLKKEFKFDVTPFGAFKAITPNPDDTLDVKPVVSFQGYNLFQDSLAKVAKSKGYEFLLTGSISNVGAITILKLDLVGFGNDTIVLSDTYESDKGIEDIYTNGVKSVTNAIIEEYYIKIPQLVEISTRPAGATISINGENVGISPFSKTLKRGSYNAIVTKDTYIDSAFVFDVDGEEVYLNIALQHTKQYLDSMVIVNKNAREDAVLKAGLATSATTPQDFYNRLILPLKDTKIQTVAVLPFVVTDSTLQNDGLYVAEFGVDFFIKNSDYSVVKKTELEKYITKTALSQTDTLSDSTLIESGKLMSAKYVVAGTLTNKANKLFHYAKVIDTETGEIVSSASLETQSKNLHSIYLDTLGSKTLMSAIVYKSLVLPGWGQIYAGSTLRGSIYSALFAGSLGATIWSIIDVNKKDNELDTYKDYDPSTVTVGETPQQWTAKANAAVEDKNSAATRTNILIGVTAAVWTANVVDAIILGNKQSNEIKKTYFTSSYDSKTETFDLQLSYNF